MAEPRRMRTITQAMAYIREQDPHTALTECAIRRMVNKGVIPHFPVNSKKLIALEDLEEYLRTGQPVKRPERGTIRRIDERQVRQA